ncbi:hypothetical protein GXM_04024 [Nostoc sphaeroides CCNUC1]|uniref:Uncharacterized protein n=1 Tax=Nostoc sphaeroides CCNUC1 TaxID=2653204 RepID=A0A5P8W1H2_9NOSO|nr:hypothetical protein GXM_04024 [Nostoc sphaeroides CCNUC1]
MLRFNIFLSLHKSQLSEKLMKAAFAEPMIKLPIGLEELD